MRELSINSALLASKNPTETQRQNALIRSFFRPPLFIASPFGQDSLLQRNILRVFIAISWLDTWRRRSTLERNCLLHSSDAAMGLFILWSTLRRREITIPIRAERVLKASTANPIYWLKVLVPSCAEKSLL